MRFLLVYATRVNPNVTPAKSWGFSHAFSRKTLPLSIGLFEGVFQNNGCSMTSKRVQTHNEKLRKDIFTTGLYTSCNLLFLVFSEMIATYL